MEDCIGRNRPAARDLAGAAEPVRRGKRAAARARPRGRAAGDRTAVEKLLKDKGVTPTGAFLDQGRLTLRFASKQDQLKARDIIAEAPTRSVHHRAVAGLARSRVDAQPRLEPAQAGTGPARRGVPGVPGRRAGAVTAAGPSRAGLPGLAAQRARSLPGRAVDYHADRVRVLFRDADSFAKGKAAILADNRNLTLTETTATAAGAGLVLAPAEDQGAPGLCGAAEHRHPAQPPQQPRACGVRAAGRARGG